MILYFHGFNSVGDSSNTQNLKDLLSKFEMDLVAPTYPAHKPKEAINFLEGEIEKYIDNPEELVLMGSSVGGYYARYLADKYGLKCVLVNPALEPLKTLKGKVGPNVNYATGAGYTFTIDDLADFGEYDLKGKFTADGILVLLNEGDEVIDCNVATQEFWDKGKVVIYPFGEHRFKHSLESVAEIVQFNDSIWS